MHVWRSQGQPSALVRQSQGQPSALVRSRMPSCPLLTAASQLYLSQAHSLSIRTASLPQSASHSQVRPLHLHPLYLAYSRTQMDVAGLAAPRRSHARQLVPRAAPVLAPLEDLQVAALCCGFGGESVPVVPRSPRPLKYHLEVPVPGSTACVDVRGAADLPQPLQGTQASAHHSGCTQVRVPLASLRDHQAEDLQVRVPGRRLADVLVPGAAMLPEPLEHRQAPSRGRTHA